VKLATWVDEPGFPVRPWITLVVNVSRGFVLAQQLGLEQPTPNAVYDCLAGAMDRPLAGPRGRPAEVQFPADAGLDVLRAPLGETGIRWASSEDLQPFGEVVAELTRHMGGDGEPGLLDIPGVTPERAGRFYDAAADFYVKAPWEHLEFESAIEITSDRFPGGPWYAVVMGRGGMTMGLTLYDDLRLLRRMWDGMLSDEENTRLTVATTVTFGEAYEIPVGDLDAAERLGWKVAGPDAYPHAFRKERGMSMRPPTPTELDLLEACLRAVPAFVSRRHQDDPAPETVTVRAGEGEATLCLAWVTDV
jgi:hypothetical protein